MKKIKKLINHLRAQPEEARIQILHTTMLVFAVILFIAWTFSFAKIASSPKGSLKEDLKPISAFKDRIVESSDDISWPSSVNYADMNISE